eukprot:TRINITY_DN8764_c0_g1_i2.p1 TRINITY_DN8764_c0_g1~~TRINITY_DN8764_c0_g1_i2.p1  ORF type:complete len:539 (-),score=80.92 TRINITY_DN8764_c0_g1_i2:95-1624(-)
MPAVVRAAWIALLLAARAAFGAPAQDLVAELPGWDRPLLSKTYAGYISAGEEDGYKMHEHYLFFESEGNPETDPLVMWTNGGPGASSFFGSFVELGPYYLSGKSLRTDAYHATGVPTLFENHYRWTKLGSLLIRNLPPPIGFSYCDPVGPAGDGYSCGSWNDTKTAKHSVEFMKNWLSAFSEYKGRDLYLVGESYAGIYVPMLAREILQEQGSDLAAQLKGFAVGDGCIGGAAGGGCVPNRGPFFTVEFFHGHGQFSDKTYAKIQRSCSHHELVNGVSSASCKAALDLMDEEKGYSFAYNLYDECYDFALSGAMKWHEQRSWWGPPRAQSRASPTEEQSWHMDGSPCGGTAALAQWVNAPTVKQALHVAKEAYFCTGDDCVGFTYNRTEPSLVLWYKEVVEQNRLRILIFNGDSDPALNSLYAQNWTSAVGIPELESWRPWTRDGSKRMGGYVTRYNNNFDFLTIRGSGHMVPEYKPEAAFVMLKAFLSNADYPRYKPPQPAQSIDVIV